MRYIGVIAHFLTIDPKFRPRDIPPMTYGSWFTSQTIQTIPQPTDSGENS